MSHKPHLFEPLTLKSVTLPNRVVISPMCQYSAEEGLANDWHFAHLAQFALGGAGAVILEATAVAPEGRITHGDLGLWNDAQIVPLRRIADFLASHGSVPAIQIGHAGRKGSAQRPWRGNLSLTGADAAYGDRPWQTVSASPVPVSQDWHVPSELTEEQLELLCTAFSETTRRALAAGFQMVELHAAHGYLLHQFLSPLSNFRTDRFGGSLQNRMRFPIAVGRAMRDAWPSELPLLARISCVDGMDGGWTIEDSLVFARALKEVGFDLIDCSSGGIAGAATAARLPRELGFQVEMAEAIRNGADMPTMAVGLIIDPQMAEAIIRDGKADLVAIGREALHNPFWPRHAAQALTEGRRDYTDWPDQYGWWLSRREAVLEKIGRG